MELIEKEKIKAEIERLQAKTSIGLNEYTAGYENGKAEVCRLLLGFINSLQKEPVSEDLEEYEKEYFEKWKDDIISVYDRHAGLVDGAWWQKEKMMAKAVDGEVGYWNIRGLSINMELPRKFEEGDKVKLVIIKED